MPIRFHLADIRFTLKNKTLLKQFIEKQFKAETGRTLQLSYIFCSDEYLLDINRRFLNHDFYTDIITFPLTQTDTLTEAEIYISIDRVKENAILEKVTFENELLRVLFHGVLHLAGYDDHTKKQKAHLRLLEDSWMGMFTESQQIDFI